MQKSHTLEKGNVVTLTLVALAVAVLAGVVVLFLAGRREPVPLPPVGEMADPSDLGDEAQQDPRANWPTYTDDTYSFSVQYPPGWIVDTGTYEDQPVVTLRPDMGTTTEPGPWNDRTSGTFVSIFPQGLQSEGVFYGERKSMVIIPVPQAVARDFVLTNKHPWATKVTFEQYPDTWSASGYVFARANIEGEEETCMRDGEEVEGEQCDTQKGDTLNRTGFVDPAMRSLEELILTSFSFSIDPEQAAANALDDLIQVTSPHPDALVTSPLVVEGQARGTWFFEASFGATLYDNEGKVLVATPVTTSADWMTESFVPFSVSLAFAGTTATSGVLVLEKANPSGLPEHAATYEIPVRFK